MDISNLTKSANQLFKSLNIKAHIDSCKSEGSFLVFDVILDDGGTFKKLERFSTEIALALKSLSEPLIYPITKKGIIRMEIMVSALDTVLFKDVIEDKKFTNLGYKLPIALGKLRDGSNLIIDLTEMPHLLIGGATGAGKSIMLHVIINSLFRSGCKLALIDPKRVEFSYYEKLPLLFGPVAKNVKSSILLLNNLIVEMNNRFLILEKSGCRDITYYKGQMSYVVVIIDELADLMMASKKEVQELVCKLAQKSRACGIHLVAATQRPSVDIITGLIKANFPSRISCQVSSNTNSRIILDRGGAEKLAGKGDAIIDCPHHSFKRFKCSYINEDEIISSVSSKKSWWRKIWNL